MTPTLSPGSTAGRRGAGLNTMTAEMARSAGDEARTRDPYLGKVVLYH
jgi:hypothetical protein